MVNLATLNYLPELQQYEAQIPRLEEGWWPTGGAVNPAADGGLMNWQASLLANRTAFLKKVIDDAGLGAAAVPLVTLNSAQARLTGSYRFASTDANTPAAGVAGTVEVIAASASAVNQTAFDSASSRMFTRFWNGTVWSAWSEIWRTTGVAESLAANGWQRLPSGLILQWGSVSGTTGALAGTGAAEVFVNGTFPLTFPTACTVMLASPADVVGNAFQEQAFAVPASTSAFTVNLQCRQASTAMSARWFAVGY
jgi:hypothetical protein